VVLGELVEECGIGIMYDGPGNVSMCVVEGGNVSVNVKAILTVLNYGVHVITLSEIACIL
jgi:hypothetical protein